MTEIADHYTRVAEGFASRLEASSPEMLASRSPCEEWTGRDVASHVVHVHRRVLAALDATDAAPPAPDEDLVVAFRDASGGVCAVLADPARATMTVAGIFGEQPFDQLVGSLLCADTLVHTWDLARATGQDARLDPDAVAEAQTFLEPIDDAIRRPGGFGPKITPPDDADAQTKLLAFTGRRV